jgi:hypothetical protein
MGFEVGQNWHERLPLDLICHIRRGNIDDLARLARLSIGQAVGLVLSSGARGALRLPRWRSTLAMPKAVDAASARAEGPKNVRE